MVRRCWSQDPLKEVEIAQEGGQMFVQRESEAAAFYWFLWSGGGPKFS